MDHVRSALQDEVVLGELQQVLATAWVTGDRATVERIIAPEWTSTGTSRSMEFRRATPDDAELILRFWKASGASMGATDDVEHLRRVVENPAAVLLLAVAEDEIVGTLLGAFDGWRGNLYRLVVHPSRRRQGIARQLVREGEHVFAGWGVRRITVLIEVDRPWAMEFWTAVGYPRDEHIVRHVGTLD